MPGHQFQTRPVPSEACPPSDHCQWPCVSAYSGYIPPGFTLSKSVTHYGVCGGGHPTPTASQGSCAHTFTAKGRARPLELE